MYGQRVHINPKTKSIPIYGVPTVIHGSNWKKQRTL